MIGAAFPPRAPFLDCPVTTPRVLQSEDLDPAAAAWLRESCDLVECHFSHQPRFDELLAGAEGLVVRTYTRVDQGLLDRAPRLRVVGRAGVGLDHIDVNACRRRGVEVVHTPAANCDAVAEYVFAILFGALRPKYRLRSAIDLAEWNRVRKGHEATSQLGELTLGVLGLGRVGSRVARIARGVGTRVLYNDLLNIPESSRHGATPVPIEALLRDSDVVTIHVDGRSENRKWFSDRFCALLRPTAIVINTSRGLVLDEAALARWLRAHPAGTALIDVHDPEPFGPNYPLLGLENAVLSPHLAAGTAAAHAAMSWVVKDVWRVLSGLPPEHPAP